MAVLNAQENAAWLVRLGYNANEVSALLSPLEQGHCTVANILAFSGKPTW